MPGVLGVIASLVFVGIQIRQGADATRSATVLQLIVEVVAVWVTLLSAVALHFKTLVSSAILKPLDGGRVVADTFAVPHPLLLEPSEFDIPFYLRSADVARLQSLSNDRPTFVLDPFAAVR